MAAFCSKMGYDPEKLVALLDCQRVDRCQTIAEACWDSKHDEVPKFEILRTQYGGEHNWCDNHALLSLLKATLQLKHASSGMK